MGKIVNNLIKVLELRKDLILQMNLEDIIKFETELNKLCIEHGISRKRYTLLVNALDASRILGISKTPDLLYQIVDDFNFLHSIQLFKHGRPMFGGVAIETESNLGKEVITQMLTGVSGKNSKDPLVFLRYYQEVNAFTRIFREPELIVPELTLLEKGSKLKITLQKNLKDEIGTIPDVFVELSQKKKIIVSDIPGSDPIELIIDYSTSTPIDSKYIKAIENILNSKEQLSRQMLSSSSSQKISHHLEWASALINTKNVPIGTDKSLITAKIVNPLLPDLFKQYVMIPKNLPSSAAVASGYNKYLKENIMLFLQPELEVNNIPEGSAGYDAIKTNLFTHFDNFIGSGQFILRSDLEYP